MDRIVVILNQVKKKKKIDLDIPLYITANDLVIALNQAYNLGIDTEDVEQCYLKTENPISLLKGNKTLYDYKLHNGTIINIV